MRLLHRAALFSFLLQIQSNSLACDQMCPAEQSLSRKSIPQIRLESSFPPYLARGECLAWTGMASMASEVLPRDREHISCPSGRPFVHWPVVGPHPPLSQ